MEKIRCNLCSSNDFELCFKKKGNLTKIIFNIVKCKNCGLIFVNPRLTKKENLKLYNENYFKGKGFDSSVGYVSREKLKEKEKEAFSILNKIQLFKDKEDIEILDVGCGTGSFIKALENKGYKKIIGLDFAKFATDFAKNYVQSKIITDDFLEYNFKKRKFDVINATEVIEHIRDPLKFFKKIKKHLKKTGLFIYSTGNVDSIYAKLFRGVWPYLNPEGHLFYFSPRILSLYFEKVGLKPLKFEGLDKQKKKKLLKYEDKISYFFINFIGKNDDSVKGFVFRIIGKMPEFIIARLLTLFTGKYKLPLALNKQIK